MKKSFYKNKERRSGFTSSEMPSISALRENKKKDIGSRGASMRSPIAFRKGFTLIEILIVVAIIAILASIVLVGIGPTEQLGRDARRVSDLHSIQTALELYYAQSGSYPAALTNIPNTLIGGNALPQDPTNSGTHVYNYAVSADGQSYLLWDTLENSGGSSFQGYQVPTNLSDFSNAPTCVKPIYCLTL